MVKIFQDMRYLIKLSIAMFLISSVNAEAQTDVSIRKKDFKKDKQGFEDAWKNVTSGDSYYALKGVWYGNAFEEYKKAMTYNNSNAELNYKTGASALFSDNKEKAAAYLVKAVELKSKVADDIFFLAARALQYAGKFTEAIDMYGKFLSLQVKKSDSEIAKINKYIDECNSAITITRDTLKITIKNLGGTINSYSDDYSEILTPGGKVMYFASRRELEKSGKRNTDTKFDENIFFSSLKSGSWTPAVLGGNNINTDNCETPVFINSAGDKLYIYAGYENGGDIKVAQYKKNEWKAPEQLDYSINTAGAETSFCISKSGNEIYYITDNGKDGRGGKDIYLMKKLTDKKWTKPQNAGDVINSALDEESVKLSESGDTLWFSSKGHNSIGGFDIFYSIKNHAGEWDSVRNAGYPLNSQWDELFFLPVPGCDTAFYFVSNRSGGLGGMDIYKGLRHASLRVVLPPGQEQNDNLIKKDSAVIKKENSFKPVDLKESPLIVGISPHK
jgi:tetratricopeptide (TPR) repeat protein